MAVIVSIWAHCIAVVIALLSMLGYLLQQTAMVLRYLSGRRKQKRAAIRMLQRVTDAATPD